MVLAELLRAEKRHLALDAEHSGLPTTIDLMCGHLGVPRSRKLSAQASKMTLIADRIRELEVITFWLGVHYALVANWPLSEDSIERI